MTVLSWQICRYLDASHDIEIYIYTMFKNQYMINQMLNIIKVSRFIILSIVQSFNSLNNYNFVFKNIHCSN